MTPTDTPPVIPEPTVGVIAEMAAVLVAADSTLEEKQAALSTIAEAIFPHEPVEFTDNIPAATDHDYDCELDVLYHFHSCNPQRSFDEAARSLIRRCHAAESAARAKDAEIERLTNRVRALEEILPSMQEIERFWWWQIMVNQPNAMIVRKAIRAWIATLLKDAAPCPPTEPGA